MRDYKSLIVGILFIIIGFILLYTTFFLIHFMLLSEFTINHFWIYPTILLTAFLFFISVAVGIINLLNYIDLIL